MSTRNQGQMTLDEGIEAMRKAASGILEHTALSCGHFSDFNNLALRFRGQVPEHIMEDLQEKLLQAAMMFDKTTATPPEPQEAPAHAAGYPVIGDFAATAWQAHMALKELTGLLDDIGKKWETIIQSAPKEDVKKIAKPLNKAISKMIRSPGINAVESAECW